MQDLVGKIFENSTLEELQSNEYMTLAAVGDAMFHHFRFLWFVPFVDPFCERCTSRGNHCNLVALVAWWWRCDLFVALIGRIMVALESRAGSRIMVALVLWWL
jgi:hypothetical protein